MFNKLKETDMSYIESVEDDPSSLSRRSPTWRSVEINALIRELKNECAKRSSAPSYGKPSSRTGTKMVELTTTGIATASLLKEPEQSRGGGILNVLFQKFLSYTLS